VRRPRQLLAERGLSPKKSFGQNFLIDDSVCADIARACAKGATDAIEFGAGTGALTRELLALGMNVVAVERDRDLIPILQAEFESELSQGTLRLVEGDAKEFVLEGHHPSKFVLCGNLPYQLTGPLLERTTQHAALLERAVFMVQEEVAQRLIAPAGSKAYGALSVFLRAQFRVRKVRGVASGCFFPAPDVESAVVELSPRGESGIPETETFRKLVRLAFTARRKTLRNAWRGVASDEQLMAACRDAGIDLTLRGETLEVEAFAKLASLLDAYA
jgi:16S rRNA (adenine1518-N6/adenine1519-N6)-dimethyltransferase